jgi:hypothetical protein
VVVGICCHLIRNYSTHKASRILRRISSEAPRRNAGKQHDDDSQPRYPHTCKIQMENRHSTS